MNRQCPRCTGKNIETEKRPNGNSGCRDCGFCDKTERFNLSGPKRLPIHFKTLSPNAMMPRRGSAGAAGFDLTATSVSRTGYVFECGTGIAVEIPPGYVGLIFPRSGIYKTGMALANSVGVIDSDYRGEITFKFYVEWPNQLAPYDIGDRIGQLIIMPIPEVEYVEVSELTTTERGSGGYGSTGR